MNIVPHLSEVHVIKQYVGCHTHISQIVPDSFYCTQKVQGHKRWLKKKKPNFLIIFTYSKSNNLHRNLHYVHINRTSNTKYLSWAPLLTLGVVPPSHSISIPCHKFLHTFRSVHFLDQLYSDQFFVFIFNIPRRLVIAAVL